MSWPVVTLDSIKADAPYACVGGPFGSNLTSKHYVDDGVPVIRGQNLGGSGCFDENGFVFVTPEKADQLRPNLAFRGDVLFTQRGTLGQVGLIPLDSKYDRYVVSQSQMKLTVDARRVDARYVYQYFRLESTIQEILNRTITAGVPHINLGILKAFELPLPPLQAQQGIAEVAEAYDDLIATNQRRIALLEDAARRLYREWFVHLRFPGHESVQVKDGVPPEWNVVPLSGICNEVRDMVDPTAISPETPYLSMEHMPQKSISLSVWEFAQKVGSTKLRFQTGDVLFGKIRPYFHKVGLAAISGITSTDVIVVRAKNPVILPLVLMVTSSDNFVDHAVATSNGTKMPRADWKVLRQWPVLLPNEPILQLYQDAVAPMLDQMSSLMLQNRSLSKARDLLLPKLMSGQIDVSGIPLPDEVAA